MYRLINFFLSSFVHIIFLKWNQCVQSLVYKKNPLFRNNLTNLWGSCGNLFFFSVSPACTSVMCHSLLQRLSGGTQGCVVRISVSPGARQTPTPTSCLTHVTVSGAWCYLELLWRRVSHEPQGVVQCLVGFRDILKPVFHYLILCFVCFNLSWKSETLVWDISKGDYPQKLTCLPLLQGQEFLLN